MTRRQLNLLALLIATGCTPTQVSAGQAAIDALKGAIVDVTTAINSGNFTGAALDDLQKQLAALNTQLGLLLPTSTSSQVASVWATVQTILGVIGTYLPSILQLLPVLGILSAPHMIPGRHTEAVDGDVLKSLKAHLLALKAAAGQ